MVTVFRSIVCFSVQPLFPLCLGGELIRSKAHHGDTEVAQRRADCVTSCAKASQQSKTSLRRNHFQFSIYLGNLQSKYRDIDLE